MKKQMGQHKYDLAVAIRTYPGIAKSMLLFPGNKLKLFEFCTRSFKAFLGPLHVKCFGVLDGCPKEFEDVFEKYFGDSDLELIRLKPTTDGGTLQTELNVLTEQDYSDIVYFAEDDYFYFPDEMKNLISILNMPGVDFVTPNDDPDYYKFVLHDHTHKWVSYAGRRWRNVISCAFTFLTRKSTAIKVKHVFETFLRQWPERPYDFSAWISLTKINAKNPIKLYKILRENHYYFRSYLRSWRSEFNQLAFGKKYTLWAPQPSIATHMLAKKVAPYVDWDKEFKRLLSEDDATVITNHL